MEPVVLDEAEDGTLVGYGVVHKIPASPGRDHHERLARAIAATALGMKSGRVDAGKSKRAVAAKARGGKSIGSSGGLIEHGTHLMVIPSIGIVVQDHDRGIVPVPGTLEEVDGVDDERLLIQRVGITCVAVLKTGRLEEADFRVISV